MSAHCKEQTAGCRYNWSRGSDSLLSPSELSARLFQAGLELEQAVLSAGTLKKIIVAKTIQRAAASDLIPASCVGILWRASSNLAPAQGLGVIFHLSPCPLYCTMLLEVSEEPRANPGAGIFQGP